VISILRARAAARVLCGVALLASACASPVDTDPPSRPASAVASSAVPVEERIAVPLPSLVEPPRGLGSMTARRPGSNEIVGGVRLASHHAHVTVAQGIAHTEVEEEFRNDTAEVLEGRLVFPLAEGATLARLALLVGSQWVEGEVVAKLRADRIFRGIVDDTVRPRDPALLDMIAGGRLSLRIFPIPAHGSRKVLFAYDQVLRREAGERFRYVHPLSLGSERATPIEAVTVTVDGTVHFSGHDLAEVSDVVVSLDGEPPPIAIGTTARGAERESAVVLRSTAPEDSFQRPFAGDLVLALDVSEGQSSATLGAQIALAAAVLDELEPEEEIAILACDSACSSFPADGRARATPAAIDEARLFLGSLEAGGPADPAGALADASRRLDRSRPGQVILLSHGAPTAGELSVETALAHVTPLLAGIDLRVIGVGRTVDHRFLSQLSRGLSATYDPLVTGAPLAERIERLAGSRRAPVNPAPSVELPRGIVDPRPSAPPPTRIGEEIIVLARAAEPIEGAVETSAPVPRLWAREHVAELESRGDAADPAIAALSVRHHLLSRATSLLVLENDRMFAEFGIARTVLPGGVGARGTDAWGELPAAEGAGYGQLSGSHVVRPPTVRMGMTHVSGRLPPEAVQRVVRQSFGRFRACYERGLLPCPGLTGRITTRFVIGRDGAVRAAENVASDVTDGTVVTCVTEAFRGLSFPEPEGGVVTVVYPIVFSPRTAGETPPEDLQKSPVRASHRPLPLDVGERLPRNSALRPPPWEPPPVEAPTATHRRGDDGWLEGNAPRLASLAARVVRDPAKRRGHLDLIRAQLVSGHFEDALRSATALAALDPDLPAAREAIAEASAVLGRSRDAVRATSAASALDPRSIPRQLAAARSAAALHDGRRACAHVRALGDLVPKEHGAAAESCRRGAAPALPDRARNGFEARGVCEGASCPSLVVVTPEGRVLSSWTGASSAEGVVTGPLMGGTYRTLAVGNRGGAVSVRALGVSHTERVPIDEPRRTAVISEITIPAPRRVPIVRFLASTREKRILAGKDAASVLTCRESSCSYRSRRRWSRERRTHTSTTPSPRSRRRRAPRTSSMPRRSSSGAPSRSPATPSSSRRSARPKRPAPSGPDGSPRRAPRRGAESGTSSE
jgi:hypothetical protein